MARYEIVDGPSKLELMLGLFDTDKRGDPRSVAFSIRDGGENYLHLAEHETILSTVQRIDGENWAFQGRWLDNHQWLSVRGQFSTKVRNGWVEV